MDMTLRRCACRACGTSRVLSGDSTGARKQSRAACDISPRGRIARRSFSAVAINAQAFENSTMGYTIDIDPQPKQNLERAALIFAHQKMINRPKLGDSEDRHNNNLHMGIFPPIREGAVYKRVETSGGQKLKVSIERFWHTKELCPKITSMQ